MTENWKIQVSPKTPGGALINIRAENGDELRRGLAFVREHAQEILDTEALLSGASVVVNAGITAPDRLPTTYEDQPPPFVQPVAPASNGPACKHGPMVQRFAKPGVTTWKSAWFCPTPRNTPDQCEPQGWVK